MMAPRVSVVMPSYNHAAFVAQAVQSVIDQSYQDWELVVTDDASIDGTPEVISGFKDSRIDLKVSPVNRGGVPALNDAIKRSRGEFVCYLASDDYFLPGKLERQVAYLDANPEVHALFGQPRRVDERGAPLPGDPTFLSPFRDARVPRERWLRHFFFSSNSICAPTAMIRRSILDEVGLYDARLWGLPDFDLWVRICMKADIHVLHEPLSAFRLLDGARNISASRRDSTLRDMFEFLEVLRHFRTMDEELARRTFAEDIQQHGISTEVPFLVWLSEVALLGKRNAHKLFALQALFDGVDPEEGSRRLVEISGSADPFKLYAERDLIQRAQEFEAAKTKIANAAAHHAIGRNDPCPCGSGKKYKACHGR